MAPSADQYTSAELLHSVLSIVEDAVQVKARVSGARTGSGGAKVWHGLHQPYIYH